jgi:glycosyltransferase involved in cell wall biosynthesis
MKKVVIFIPTLSTAGAEKFVVDLALSADKNQYDITVAVTSKLDNTQFYSLLEKNNIKVVGFNERSFLKKTLRIYCYLRRVKAEVVHANLGSLLHIQLAVAMSGIKTRIFTFHSVAYRAAGKSRIKKILYSCAFKKMKFIPVGISDYVRKSIADEYNISLESIPCIYNGVDTNFFTPSIEEKENSNTIRFISIGRLDHVKNHKLLIKAFAKTEKLYPNITLSILGDGVLREELELLIKGYGLENKIKLLGTKHNVVSYLRQSDIYVMSSNVEGLPLSMLEAMACQLPIISTKAGGVVDIVVNGKNGLITPVGDTKALSEAMCELIRNEDLRKKMGEESRRIAVEQDINKCVEKYQKLYAGKWPTSLSGLA